MFDDVSIVLAWCGFACLIFWFKAPVVIREIGTGVLRHIHHH